MGEIIVVVMSPRNHRNGELARSQGDANISGAAAVPIPAGKASGRGILDTVSQRVPGATIATPKNPRRRLALPGTRGTAAVELALISPMLLILLAGIIDFGRAYHQEIQLSSAVAAAAQYALVNAANVNSANATQMAATISGIVANSNGTGWGGAAVTVNGGATSIIAGGATTAGGAVANADSCWCPTGTPANLTWGSAASCGSACGGGGTAGKFVSITGSRSFSAIFGRYGLIGNRDLHQSSVVQSQ